jgi:hypothetical protein
MPLRLLEAMLIAAGKGEAEPADIRRWLLAFQVGRPGLRERRLASSYRQAYQCSRLILPIGFCLVLCRVLRLVPPWASWEVVMLTARNDEAEPADTPSPAAASFYAS